jgi:hypothetical protein
MDANTEQCEGAHLLGCWQHRVPEKLSARCRFQVWSIFVECGQLINTETDTVVGRMRAGFGGVEAG